MYITPALSHGYINNRIIRRLFLTCSHSTPCITLVVEPFPMMVCKSKDLHGCTWWDREVMYCYSLLLLALTFARSFCVVARSPFLTACRRSCSFPMISTSQNSTSVPQESCSSLTPPYSGATAAWTYPRILSFSSATVGVGDSQTSEGTASNQISVLLQQSRHPNQQTSALRLVIYTEARRNGKSISTYKLPYSFSFLSFQSLFRITKSVLVAWRSVSGNVEALLMLWFRKLRRPEWHKRPKPGKVVGKKIVLLIHQPSTVYEQSSKREKVMLRTEAHYEALTASLWDQIKTLFTFQTIPSQGKATGGLFMLKGIVHPKLSILLPFNHQCLSNPYDFLLWNTQKKKCYCSKV